MRILLITLAAMLAACQGRVPVAVDGDLDSGYKGIANNGGQLVGALEKFKEILRNGNSSLGIPALDPLDQEHLDVNLAKESIVSVTGTLDNLRAKGLADYKVKRGDFMLAGLKVGVDLEWDRINLVSEYDLKGTLLDELSFFGKGTAALAIKGVAVSVDMKLRIKGGKLFVSELELHVHLQKLDCYITGLYDDEEISKTLSQVISDIVPGLIDDYQDQLSAQASPLVADLLNGVLKNLTAKDLLAIIKG